MDEADLLSDKIGIMVQGKLACYGSSLFLKERVGENINLIFERQDQSNSSLKEFVERDYADYIIEVDEGAKNLIRFKMKQNFQQHYSRFFE